MNSNTSNFGQRARRIGFGLLLAGFTMVLGLWNCPAQSDVRYGIVNRWNRLAAAGGAVATNTAPNAFAYGGTNYDRSASGAVIIPVYRGRGMAFFGSIQNAPNTNAVVTYGLDLSYDGTNWTTTQPIRFTAVCNGSTAAVFYTNVLADSFDNAAFARLGTITGSLTNNYVTNNWLAWSAFQ